MQDGAGEENQAIVQDGPPGVHMPSADEPSPASPSATQSVVDEARGPVDEPDENGAAAAEEEAAAAASIACADADIMAELSEPETPIEPTSRHPSRDECDITMGAPTDWRRLRSWIRAVCIVGFDLEIGPTLESSVPASPGLAAADIKNICFHAFPDSNSTEGDLEFCFRFTLQGESTAMFGFVFFRQVADRELRRGFFQKSVVILSEFPFSEFYTAICRTVATAYFQHGQGMIETACAEMSAWPPPVPDIRLDLTLLNQRLSLEIAGHGVMDFRSQPPPDRPMRNSLLNETLVTPLLGCLPQVHLLWEMMLTGEPMVVMALTPAISSQVVLSLVSLISPLQYGGDYRPYFTIHDPDYPRLMKKTTLPSAMVVGVTNPHFTNGFAHWPHKLRIFSVSSPRKKRSSSARAKPTMQRAMSGLPPESVPVKPTLPERGSSPNIGVKRFGCKSGLTTTLKEQLREDRLFTKNVLSNPDLTPEDLTMCLRRHFYELTQQFVMPLDRFVTRLMPLKRDVSPFRPLPRFPDFHVDDFFASLREHLKTQPRKGNWTALYSRFIESGNFRLWLKTRARAANNELLRLYLSTVCETDMQGELGRMAELKLMDLYIQIKQSMRVAVKRRLVDAATAALLQVRLDSIVAHLPPDTQRSLQIRGSGSEESLLAA